MNSLNLLLIIPILTAVGILLTRKDTAIKGIALAGSILQFVVAIAITLSYVSMRHAGNTEAMLFQTSYEWFAPLHIFFRIGVDGISLTMIMLTAMVVLAGILVSWKIVSQVKEFFFLIIFLSLGA
jgi:NADH-quinone oxidoreductase subunit M